MSKYAMRILIVIVLLISIVGLGTMLGSAAIPTPPSNNHNNSTRVGVFTADTAFS